MSAPASGPDSCGRFYGIGVGPGDPELLTLKAWRLIRQCDVITYLSSDRGYSMAREIAADALDNPTNPAQRQQAFVMPMCDNREVANRIYDQAAQVIASHLDEGRDVGFLCQGDPLLFGSFSCLQDRLSGQYPTFVVPGINSINACAALTGTTMTRLAENLAVISGRRDDDDILDTLVRFDNVAIMKPGRRRARILQLIERSNRSEDACYVEYAGHPRQKIVRDIRTLDDGTGPYFSLFLIRCSKNHPL